MENRNNKTKNKTFKTIEILKKTAALALVLSMALSLCACGSSSGTGSTDTGAASGSASTASDTAAGSKSDNGTGAAASNTAAASDAIAAGTLVYKAEFTPVTGDEKISYVTPQKFTSDGFYATGTLITGSHAPEGVEPQYFGQFDDPEPGVVFIGYDGKVSILENYKSVELPGAEEGMYGYTTYSYINGFDVLSDGNLLILESAYRAWTDSEDIDYESDDYFEHYHYTNDNYIRVTDPTGKEISCAVLEVPTNEYMYSSGSSDSDGNILYTVSTDSGEYCVKAINTAGETVYTVECEDYIDSLVSTSDGTIYVTSWGNLGMELKKLDPETHTFSESTGLPSNAYSMMAGDGDYDLYYTSGVYFYGLDTASGEAVKLFSWMDCDIDPDEAYYAHVDSDGTVRILVNNYDSYTMSYSRCVAAVKKTPYDPTAEKKVLTLGTQYLSWEMRNAVIDFNRSSNDVRIEVLDYSEYNTEEDYSAGLTKMNTEIIAGNCPDIIAMSGLSVSQLAAKGLIEDLYPYMDADSELNRDDYYANVLAAAEYDGKLMHTASYFSINTAVGASSIVGDEPGWTYAELENALKDMREGCEAFDATVTRDEMLSMCLNLNMDSLVDWSTGEVNFDNEDFVDLLTFCALFPETYDWETYDYTTDSPDVRLAEGMQMLYSSNIYSMDELMYIETTFCSADGPVPVTFKGYPVSEGTGNTINIENGYAMSSSCSDKEAAWSFLRTFFTEKYYANHSYYGLPLQKAYMEKLLKKATTMTYQLDENGEYKLDANGEKMPEKHYFARNDGAYEYYCMSETMAERFTDLLETTTRTSVDDESIKDIVTRQAAAFFAGQKSAEEVAKLIQSNARIYVNEQR